MLINSKNTANKTLYMRIIHK